MNDRGLAVSLVASPRKKIGLFGARAAAETAQTELQQAQFEMERLRAEAEHLRDELARTGALGLLELQRQSTELRESIEKRRATANAQFESERSRAEESRRSLEQRLAQLKAQVVTTEESAILQEVGLYEYQHPLHDSVKYQSAIERLQDEIKQMARRDGGAVVSASGWTVNGSAAQGRTMLRDYSKLMLRAYNAEADNLVRAMKPYKLASARERLGKVVSTIERLGKTMSIRISPEYHRLRVKELELTADYREMLAREKDQEREERARLREERKVQLEIERAREKLRKEQQHYRNALDALVAKGDLSGAERIRAQLADVDKAMADVDYRAANVRAGYVYVISNLGSFGERMIKVGMTRRLEPRDRIRELSDASVPFNFDVHALFFSDDAVGIETQMHQRLAGQRVNHVNTRREFFYATPGEARELLLQLTGELLQFEEVPEAVEFRQSENARDGEQVS